MAQQMSGKSCEEQQLVQMPWNWMEWDELRTVPERKSAHNVLPSPAPNPNMKQIQSQKELILYKLCYLALRNNEDMCEVTVALKYSLVIVEVDSWLGPIFIETLK